MTNPITLDVPVVSEFERMRRAGAPEEKPGPQAASVRYDVAGRVFVLEMCVGAVLVVPLYALPDLERADWRHLSNVAVREQGTVIHWSDLQVRITVTALLEKVLGIATVTENARRAGRVKSDAKAAAVRINGKKGGRPRKHLALPV